MCSVTPGVGGGNVKKWEGKRPQMGQWSRRSGFAMALAVVPRFQDQWCRRASSQCRSINGLLQRNMDGGVVGVAQKDGGALGKVKALQDAWR
jgi:hypothetical protein